MGVYTIALTTYLLGRTLLAFRLPTALASVGTVFVVFWLGRLLFGRDDRFDCAPRQGAPERATPWRGLLVGGVGLGCWRFPRPDDHRARVAQGQLPATVSWPVSGSAVVGVEATKPVGDRAGGRVRRAAAVHLYPLTFHSLFFLFFGLSFLLPLRSFTREPGQIARHSWARLRAEWPWAAIFVAWPGWWLRRFSSILLCTPKISSSAATRSGSCVKARNSFGNLLEKRMGSSAGLWFSWRPARALQFRRSTHAEPWEALFFWLGMGTAVWRWRRPAYRLLLLWAGVLILPAMLARDVGLDRTRCA